jgi:hypothetical protein
MTLTICWASSRVGASTSAWHCFTSTSRRCKIPTAKVAVFPVPAGMGSGCQDGDGGTLYCDICAISLSLRWRVDLNDRAIIVGTDELKAEQRKIDSHPVRKLK